MRKKPVRVKWIIASGALALFSYLVISSLRQTRLKYEVCMDFKGSTHCATANGSSSSEAIQSAREIDCQMLANGRDELMVCMDQTASRVTELK
jgi:hypothetical protein